MKQSGETSKICSFSLIIIGMLIYLFIYLCIYLVIFSSTLFLLANVNCIFVRLIKIFKKKKTQLFPEVEVNSEIYSIEP